MIKHDIVGYRTENGDIGVARLLDISHGSVGEVRRLIKKLPGNRVILIIGNPEMLGDVAATKGWQLGVRCDSNTPQQWRFRVSNHNTFSIFVNSRMVTFFPTAC